MLEREERYGHALGREYQQVLNLNSAMYLVIMFHLNEFIKTCTYHFPSVEST